MISSMTLPCARFALWHVVAPLLFACAVFALFESSDLDRRFSDLFYRPAEHAFALRRAWFLDVALHEWAKYVLVLLACAVLAGIVTSFAIEALRPLRRQLLFILLAMTLGPASVGWLRTTVHKHCPVDVDIYGGFAPYQRLLDAPTPGIQPGRCWPSGHAAGGFSLFAFYFVWRRRWPRRAAAALGVALLYGSMLGVGRVLQGSLFLSYALWSAIVVWFVVLTIYLVLLRPVDVGARRTP
jgi:membrane-associated PAP2 superfamily phosphatase